MLSHGWGGGGSSVGSGGGGGGAQRRQMGEQGSKATPVLLHNAHPPHALGVQQVKSFFLCSLGRSSLCNHR